MKKRVLAVALLLLCICLLASCSHTHTYTGEWQSAEDGHYKICKCGEESTHEPHIGGKPTETDKAVCTVCAKPYGALLAPMLDAPVITLGKDGVASWSAVVNAVGYECTLNGTLIGNVTFTYFNLNNGDSLSVKAIGDGENYRDSLSSNTVKYEEAVTLAVPFVTVDKTGLATWAKVPGATGYICSYNGDMFKTLNTNSFQLNDGEIISVKAVGDGTKYLDSPYSQPVKYEAPKPLSVPVVRIDKNGVASWSAVVNATGYVVVIDGNRTLETTLTSVQLSDGETIKVQAVSTRDEFFDSDFCQTLTYQISKIYANVKDFNDMLSVNGPITDECLPSIGTPRVLVVPINLDSSKKTDKLLSDIKTAFTGTSTQTGWESVQSYYLKSSYGKLDIQFDVLDEWFTPSESASYYNNYYDEYNYADGSSLILDEVLSYYDTEIDFNDYDYNSDGFIDAVWLIYNCDVDYESYDSLYWAFQSWSYSEELYDGVYPCYYAFAGTDFMYEEDPGYDNSNIKVDAHSYIHETGHLLGLDDYYDYDTSTGPTGGMYYADMMDSNIGDHSSVSKLLLNWIDPTVISGDGEIEIDFTSFTETGFVVLIANHEISSIYDEYFLIEFYTSTGLNENDEPVYDEYGGEVYGIRILHVDAHIYYNADGEVDLNGGSVYETGFKYDNSDASKLFVDTMCKEMPENDWATPEILFVDDGVDFGIDVFKTYKYNDGTSLNFTLEIVEMTKNGATVVITME